MRTIIDLHMHSHYSRATSKQLTVPGLAKAAEIKGVDVISLGDITHPRWIQEIERDTTVGDDGFLHYQNSPTRFILTGEISCIYKKNDQARRVHTIFVVSSLERAKKINAYLTDRGFNLKSDGRPILGIDVKELAKIYFEYDDKALVIPAHIWTPWFAMFGSKSGFNSIEECFEELTPQIHAIETGLSSDPEMNWRVSNLQNVMILSNSDAHSPDKVGREANVFDLPEQTYDCLYESITQKKNLVETIEFFPEEGKYHLDGHRACNIQFTPEQTKKHKGLCPKCGMPLVVGVMNRVDELADTTVENSMHAKIPFRRIVPLRELIADALDVGPSSKSVARVFDRLIELAGNEFHLLLDFDLVKLPEDISPLVVEAIKRMRAENLHINPGYDGVFGTIHVFTEEERLKLQPKQSALDL
ncbi:MAG: endonuclease Q family protein [Candidatus Kerfeldbacteria bacterium]|nr:endonuclease Q family protein [Candidatus Kerfeldbacteria bacterium]